MTLIKETATSSEKRAFESVVATKESQENFQVNAHFELTFRDFKWHSISFQLFPNFSLAMHVRHFVPTVRLRVCDTLSDGIALGLTGISTKF